MKKKRKKLSLWQKFWVSLGYPQAALSKKDWEEKRRIAWEKPKMLKKSKHRKSR